jgi:transposase InsO family protein
MSKSNVIVLSVVQQGLSSDEAARKFGVSKRWVNKLLVRYRAGGLEALKPLSKRPRSTPHRTPQAIEDRIVKLRLELVAQGFDAGPASIAARLKLAGKKPPAISTIRRILHKHQLIVPQPKKRPRNSYIRFEADQPNETWQSDFTHWKLADGTDVEILNFLDDHSRFLLGCRAFIPVTGRNVVDVFLELVAEFDAPQSTLTDNGRVFTARFGNGRNAFKYKLQDLGILQKNSSPNHPQTQGKIERFHQTLKLHLAQKPRATSVAMLQQQLNYFRDRYNHERPHKALNGKTPAFAYQKTPKASPQDLNDFDHNRNRVDKVDSTGKVSFRRPDKMHHIGVGRAHIGKAVSILTTKTHTTVIDKATGEHLSENVINPDTDYWRNEMNPRNW